MHLFNNIPVHTPMICIPNPTAYTFQSSQAALYPPTCNYISLNGLNLITLPTTNHIQHTAIHPLPPFIPNTYPLPMIKVCRYFGIFFYIICSVFHQERTTICKMLWAINRCRI
eukprot:972658_1